MKNDSFSELIKFDEEKWLELVKSKDPKMLYAPHVSPRGRFFNPWMPMTVSDKLVRKLISLARTHAKTIPEDANYQSVETTKYSYKENGDSITFLGHASTAIALDGELILTDPFFSKFAMMIKKKINIEMDYASIPERTVVLISHNHYDHMDKKTIKKLIKRKATFIVPLKLGRTFLRYGARKVYELDWWESISVKGVKYTFLPSQHWSLRLTQPTNKTLWGSFLIEGSKKIFFSGDTGYFIGYEEYGKKFPDIDVALMGAGAYHPRWQRFYQHQNVEEFLRALKEINAKVGIPIHYGSLRLGKESVDFPAYEIDRHIEEENIENVRVLKIGDIIPMDELI